MARATGELSGRGALLERLEQLTTLADQLSAAMATSHGRLVLLGGEAGVGKTALVRRFAADHAATARSLFGACDPLHSYVSEDKEKTFCVYDAPNPEAIRKAAGKNSLPVDKITQVSVLDPYFYR